MGIKDTEEYKTKMKQFGVQNTVCGIFCIIFVLSGLVLFIIGGIDSFKENGLPFPLGIIFICLGIFLCLAAGVYVLIIHNIQKPWLAKFAAEELAEQKRAEEERNKKITKEKTKSVTKQINNYISKHNLCLKAMGQLDNFHVRTYIPKDESTIGCVAIITPEHELTILEHNFVINPSVSLRKSKHFESHEITVQTHSIYDSSGNYTPVYGKKDIGRDIEEMDAILFTTNSKGKVKTYFLKGYSDSYELTAIKCKKLGIDVDYKETRY